MQSYVVARAADPTSAAASGASASKPTVSKPAVSKPTVAPVKEAVSAKKTVEDLADESRPIPPSSVLAPHLTVQSLPAIKTNNNKYCLMVLYAGPGMLPTNSMVLGFLEKAKASGEDPAYILAAESKLAIASHDFKRATDCARKALALRSGDGTMLTLMARVCNLNEQEAEARKYLEKAGKLQILPWGVADACASGWLEYDDFEQAYAVLLKGLKLNPDNHLLRYRAADMAKNLARFKEAESHMKLILANDGKSVEQWNVYSDIARSLKNWREVVIACRHVILLSPGKGRKKTINARKHLAEALEKLGDYHGAIKQWTIAIQTLPYDRLYLVARADCYARVGDKTREAADRAAIKKLENIYTEK